MHWCVRNQDVQCVILCAHGQEMEGVKYAVVAVLETLNKFAVYNIVLSLSRLDVLECDI